MDSSVPCKHCQKTSSVTPSTRSIRCHRCQRRLLVDNIKGSSFSGTSMNLSLELRKKKVEEKLFARKKFSGSDSQPGLNGRPHPLVSATDPPPRRKRAFLCGVTYKKQKCELKGIPHDLKNMKDLLVDQFGFPFESILILAEDEPYMLPTRKNIEDAFQWLIKGIQPGDSLVFYFSGHGVRQRDFVHDEIDGFDETICPVDFQANGNIMDNYMNKVIVGPLTPGVTLHAIVDCCHSGTILDLPHVYNIVNEKWDDNHPPSGVYKGTSGGRAISFGACEDYQLAADTSAFSSEKEMNGAMTCSFVKAIKEAFKNNQKVTYLGILKSMNETLKQAQKSGCISAAIHRIFHRRILQDPLLSSSEEFDVTTEFRL